MTNALSLLLLIGWTILIPSPARAQQANAIHGAVPPADIIRPSYSDEFSGKTVVSMEQAIAVLNRRHRNAPLPGERAPAFILKEQGTDRDISLASLHKDKPVVLLFGSYQCDVLGRGWPSFLRVYETYKDRVDFVMIYVREAHATDGMLIGSPTFADPKTTQQRTRMATLCRSNMKVPFRILIDTIEDSTATRWAGWPIRVFVIGQDGVVGYSSLNGPFGFRPDSSFLHGTGQTADNDADRGYNQETLETYLKRVTTATGK